MTITKTPPVTRLEPGAPIIRAILAGIDLTLALDAIALGRPPLTEDLLADGIPGVLAPLNPRLAARWVQWIPVTSRLHVLIQIRGDDRSGPTPVVIVDPIGAVHSTPGGWSWVCTATRQQGTTAYPDRETAQRTVEWTWQR